MLIAMIFLSDLNKVKEGEIFATFHQGTLWASAGPRQQRLGPSSLEKSNRDRRLVVASAGLIPGTLNTVSIVDQD